MTKEEILNRLLTLGRIIDASQRELRELVSLLNEATPEPAAVVERPTAQAPEGPTDIAELAMKLSEEPSAVEQLNALHDALLPNELLHEFSMLFEDKLSPAVMQTGRGFYKPTKGVVGSYKEDILTTDTAKVLSWPTGFYRNTNGNTQLMIGTNSFVTIIDNLNTAPNATIIRKGAGDNSPKISFKQLTISERQQLIDELDAHFRSVAQYL